MAPRIPGIHVVVLGAGASVAAFPGGDARGQVLPTMQNLVSVVDLGFLLEREGLDPTTGDFEAAYGQLAANKARSPAIREIEGRVHDYFEALRLPKEATLYDRLLLSLRHKDVIATFNWDPFLADAYERLAGEVGQDRLPRIFHLHGNVRVGFCREHNERGSLLASCGECHRPFSPSRLLFPVQAKNYSEDPFLRREWDAVRHVLAKAFALTIFGYGAPSSDAEAVGLLKTAWKQQSERRYETVEIIDIKEKDELVETWWGFTFSHHWKVRRTLAESFIGLNPRRSVERIWIPTVEGGWPPPPAPLPETRDLAQLVIAARALMDEERA